jgi:hypothetical protein
VAYNQREQQSPTQPPLLASLGGLHFGGASFASQPHALEQQTEYALGDPILPVSALGAIRQEQVYTPGGARTQGWQQDGSHGEQQPAYDQERLGHASTWHGASDKRVFWNC